MRNLQLETAIWNLFTSPEFFEATAREFEETMRWFGSLATSRQVANFGRNNQIFDKFKQRANDFRRGAELARLGDYHLIWNTAGYVRGDARGMLEQPLHSWMSEAEYQEFDGVRVSRLMTYAGLIESALNNAMLGADGFFNPDPDCPECRDDDNGFPGDEIVEYYNNFRNSLKDSVICQIPNPIPEYVINTSIECGTGDEVPWTGVWYPTIGLESSSLTFAVKGLRMQPAYREIETTAEADADRVTFSDTETVAVATTWHPVVPSGREAEPDKELWSKAGEPCPKAGIWQPTDPGASKRAYAMDETMVNLGSAFGLTVWRWVADR